MEVEAGVAGLGRGQTEMACRREERYHVVDVGMWRGRGDEVEEQREK